MLVVILLTVIDCAYLRHRPLVASQRDGYNAWSLRYQIYNPFLTRVIALILCGQSFSTAKLKASMDEFSRRRRAVQSRSLTFVQIIVFLPLIYTVQFLFRWDCLSPQACGPEAALANALRSARATTVAKSFRPLPSRQPSSLCSGHTTQQFVIESTPLISVITTCHNADRDLLQETAKCILAQSIPSWEWIIVDDFSTETNALDKFPHLDVRVRLVRSSDSIKDSRGNLGRARNLGAAAARGDFLVFIDADDLMEPTSLEKWLFYLSSHPAAHFVNGYTRGFGAFDYEWKRGFNPSSAFRTENQVAVTSMHRRSSFAVVGGFPEQAGGLEDFELWFRYAAAGKWGGTIPEILFWYRRRPSHADRWDEFGESGTARFLARMRSLYPALIDEKSWPAPPYSVVSPLEPDFTQIPSLGRWRDIQVTNLRHEGPGNEVRRVLLLLNRLGFAVDDQVALALSQSLKTQNWLVSIFATAIVPDDSPEAIYRDSTHDLVVLARLAPPTAFPAIVSAAIALRQPQVVIYAGGLAEAMIPLLQKAHRSSVTFRKLHEEHVSAEAPPLLEPDMTYRQALYAEFGTKVLHHI